MDVIKKLNDLRLERNLSVYRLAEISGINQSTLANTFSRGTVPSIENLQILCSALGITMSQFFAEDEKFTILTKEEKEFFDNYKHLPKKVKESINEVVKTIVKNNTL